MKIEQSNVTKLYLSEIPRLDPIGVFIEDYSKSQGKITIECFGESWSHYWGAMGGRTLAEFFTSCNTSYLAGKLSDIKSGLDDYEAFELKAKKEILKLRRADEIDLDKARYLYDEVDISSLDDDDGEWWCKENCDILSEIFGEEWWYSIPQKENPDYTYLCRIIESVQDGLKQFTKSKKIDEVAL
ncbi:hypothetical protein [Vibrio hippocampi]|uniref:DUF4375 domain-containing protein n=1 Tax=Vibrio hippocampi TaxID=654686 RepID=A0ABM8ZQJ8_9VIBR|nr:hypothetical protein [Vibrio hippocampi]CAH0531245.1 hypothetical protein VHP8226_04182 [Vibrio hippocampi]